MAAQATSAPADEPPTAVIGKNGVTPPVVISAPKPKMPREARKQRISGRVLVDLFVETDGLPSHVRVLEGLGYGRMRARSTR